MPRYPRRRAGREAGISEAPWLPEVTPVTDDTTKLMTRPWLDWCRRITGLALDGGGEGGGGGGGLEPHHRTHEPGGTDVLQLQNPARLFGRGEIGAGQMQEIALGVGLTMTGTVLSAPGQGGGLVPHHTTHENGGNDAIKLDNLAPPDDNTDLNATTIRHGLLPKLSGLAGQVLNGMGLWVTPAPQQPLPHHVTHEPGGSDALALKGARRLFGRGDAGAGQVQEVTLGVGLRMDGTVLSASAAEQDGLGSWLVLTNGNPASPELVFDDRGDVIVAWVEDVSTWTFARAGQ